MLKLIKIETFKLFKRAKTWVILIAFVLLTALISYISYRDAENMKKYYGTEAQISDNKEHLNYLEEEKENILNNSTSAEAEENKKSLEEDIQSTKAEIARLEKILELEKSGDWRSIVKSQIKDLESEQEMYKGSLEHSYTVAENEKEIERLKYLLENDIKSEGLYDYNARTYLSGIIGMLGEIFLAIGIAVFASDMVSGEATPPTMKLLLTQPVSRGKVLLAKFISINLSAVSLIIGVELIGYLIVGIFCGFGDANYPITVGLKYAYDYANTDGSYIPIHLVAGSGYLIPAWKYLIKLILLQALYIIACTSVVFLISSLVKTSMVSMGISVVSMIASFVIFLGFRGLKNIARFIFVLFGKVDQLLEGTLALDYSNPNISLRGTIIMLIVWIVVSYIASNLIFTKKDILI